MSGVGDAVEIIGRRVALRDPRPEDIEARLRWATVETEWGEWDAPWEGNEPLRAEQVEEWKRRRLREIGGPSPSPRTQLWVERIGGPLLGWVCHYHHDPARATTWAGINICESAFWNQGLGTEALRLWIDYLFHSLDLNCLRLGTWSGNLRMIRCAEKCGFALEGRRCGGGGMTRWSSLCRARRGGS